ncbi:MAG: prolyl oligopeptidase family serine peptidase [Lentimicrobiaceae bacterium]|nr:prolyl oligopeptidase family serine peptidase [Lentimicrobiaceae bacterium]
MRVTVIACFLALFFAAGSYAQRQKSLSAGITMKTKTPYLVYLPKDYKKDKHKKFPLILFLHGSAERGNDPELLKKNGPPKMAEEGREFPFVIISPQCPEGQWWSVDVLDALLSKLLRRYRIDSNRVYLTGLSMGGFGTWEFAIKRPGRFAAIAPVCGGGDTIHIEKLKNVPVWAFHGAKDDVVPEARSREMVNALKRIGGNVIYTVYPEANHDVWTDTYNNPALYEWFLSHRRINTIEK